MEGVPWEPMPGRPGIEMRASVKSDIEDGMEDLPIIPETEAEDRERRARSFKIMKKDVQEHNITPHCEGCKRAISGGQARGHTDKCREKLRRYSWKTRTMD